MGTGVLQIYFRCIAGERGTGTGTGVLQLCFRCIAGEGYRCTSDILQMCFRTGDRALKLSTLHQIYTPVLKYINIYTISMKLGNYIKALIAIFICATLGWVALGALTVFRTEKNYDNLSNEVANLYGNGVSIYSPIIIYKQASQGIDDKSSLNSSEDSAQVITASSQDVKIDVDSDIRKKGNFVFSTYNSHIVANYEFEIDADTAQHTFFLKTNFDSYSMEYNNLQVEINGISLSLEEIVNTHIPITTIPKNRKIQVMIKFDSPGMDYIMYRFVNNNEDKYETNLQLIKKAKLVINTNFQDIDYYNGSKSPTHSQKTENGYILTWEFDNAVFSKFIGVLLPNKRNYGEVISKIIFFAPVTLFFFFIILFVCSTTRIYLHPMHYLFLTGSFYSFYFILAYFSDLMSVYLSFGIASLVSIVLSGTYLRLFTNKNFAFIIVPLVQLIYLILFSYAFFFESLTGISITICAVLTLFVIMQLTGKIDWNDFQISADATNKKQTKNE